MVVTGFERDATFSGVEAPINLPDEGSTKPYPVVKAGTPS